MSSSPRRATPPPLSAIEAALADGPLDGAIDLAIAALEHNVRHPLVLELVARGLEIDGRLDDAAGLLEEAVLQEPERLSALAAWVRVLGALDLHRDALVAQRRILALTPDDALAHAEAGRLAVIIGEVPAARGFYRRSVELNPQDPETWAALALIAARQGDPAQARELANRALAIQPASLAAQVALARADLSDGAAPQARERLQSLAHASGVQGADRAELLNFIGDALDMEGRSSDAFAVYQARSMAMLKLRANARRPGQGEGALPQARRLLAAVKSSDPGEWRPAGEDNIGGVREHVFLLGFPRTGTTLLEQALKGHPGLVSLEEKRMLSDATDQFLADDAGFARLKALTVSEADDLRRRYWDVARRELGQDPTGKVFLDKNPLNTARLPIIARLFPRAKILFALRDPRDVVFSAWRRLYFSYMVEFLELGMTGEYYDRLMALAVACRERLPLTFLDVRHEAIVADFQGETGRVLQFLGLDWNDAVRDFAARSADSATPSAGQVARGLTAEGVGQWRRYGAFLTPVLARLEPWVAAFGYEPTDPGLLGPTPEARTAAAEVEAAARRQDWIGAGAAADAALARGLRHPLFHRVRGVAAQAQGRVPAAVDAFELALTDSPGDAGLLSALGLCLARVGRLNDALQRLDQAIGLAPEFPPAHFNRGWTLEALGRRPEARLSFARAVELDPRNAAALGHLAGLAHQAGDDAEARRLAERALAIDPRQPVAQMALAPTLAAQGETGPAEAVLRDLLAGPSAGAHERAVAQGLLGDVLDQTGRFDDAFVRYEESAKGFRDLYAADWRTGTSLEMATRLKTTFASEDPARWRRPAAAPSSGPRHVFLLSFPRSGATMLGQALAMDPNVVTLEEQDFLADAVQTFLGAAGGVETLATLTPEAAAAYRQRYWDKVAQATGGVDKALVVDKLPMNTLALPVIVRLFPQARIVFLRRDPRDVVLSCFRRRFSLNPTTAAFLSLQGAAELYDATMALLETYKTVLDLDLADFGYEDLVADFATRGAALCDFAGIQFQPDMVNFAARSGLVATPSAGQLARGLNSDGVGHWRHYARQLSPVRSTLDSWAERFGYPRD